VDCGLVVEDTSEYRPILVARYTYNIYIQQRLPANATVIPIIISSDATHLTNFSGRKVAWPVYISIGNVPKGIRAKVNSYSTLLLGYLPIAKFDCFSTKVKKSYEVRSDFLAISDYLPIVSGGNRKPNCSTKAYS
jgi:hypothetical protein